MTILRQIWATIYNVSSILNKSRFSLIVVVLTVISLSFVGQIKDILVGLNYPDSKMQIAYFVFAVNWLAFQSWGWARFIYSQCYPVDNSGKRGQAGYQRQLIDWLPRIYAMIAFGSAYIAAQNANVNGVATGILVVGLLVVLFLYYRRTLTKFHITQVAIKFTPNRSHYYFTAIIMLATSVIAIASPVYFGNSLGAGAVIFIGLGSLIPVGTLLVSAARKNSFPVVGSLLIMAIAFSYFNDNHHVRTIDRQTASTQDFSLEKSLNTWLEQADPNRPMVLVATAGGGLRASYWTGVILGQFQELIPNFNKQVFAISGVSGGSVGAVFYNSALTDTSDCLQDNNKTPCFEDKLLQAIGKDYLAPTVASMLYGDLIQRFAPFPILSDRATALEQSWEQGFAETYPKVACGLDRNFLDLYTSKECNPANKWLPRLLINGTYEETGRRLLTTSVKVEPNIFLDTHDFNVLNGKKAIRASTAALNSARFSYVSPAGTFGDDTGHIIDGGYFENYGATTLSDLIIWLNSHDKRLSKRGLIVIVISNDSHIELSQYEANSEPTTGAAQRFLNELLAPPIGLAKTRGGHGMLAYKQLDRLLKAKSFIHDPETSSFGGKANMVHFYLKSNDKQPPPLGWILSKQSQKNMREQITSKHNCAGYQTIFEQFGESSHLACSKLR